MALAINRALHYSCLKVRTVCGLIKLAEGEMCLTGILEVPGMKFDRNRDYPTEILKGVPLLLQGNLWTDSTSHWAPELPFILLPIHHSLLTP